MKHRMRSYANHVWDFCYDKCYKIATTPSAKQERTDAFEALKAEFIATLSEEDAAAKKGNDNQILP
jgi:hypothetical protein